MPDRTSGPGSRGATLLGKAFSVPGQRESNLQGAEEESLNEPGNLVSGLVSAGSGLDGPVFTVPGSLRQNLTGEVERK